MTVAVIGATGLVGSVMLKALEERNFPLEEIIPVASSKSVGKKILFKGKEVELVSMETAIKMKPSIALFSAGGGTSLQWAPEFEKVGTVVIDNSSAWRMYADKKLIVPEVNSETLTREDKIIANPNCSTIQLVVAIAPLHRKYKIKRMILSTYQSVTGTGVKAVQQLEDERSGKVAERVYPHQIDLNCLPHGGDFDETGYTTEEHKLLNETRKILGDSSIQVSSTVVRVPVYGGHSIAANVEFETEFDLDEVKTLLSQSAGLIVQDDPENNVYPMPVYAHGKDEVFVGRIRRDFSQPKSLNMWVVADNLRKGAATNAIQIAEYLVEKGLLSS